ncbi:hypothetical protein MBM_08546 [Drepanopeziza brunnea f. sp. 'multigermtubi' MB_m1]|uniref:Uncharacterized protein n=1 Tax=Marssonina brunnea f. sp. multigermtubi (strain MB_m1) TaxID=1072389 RepID=K1WWP9_MARBU|nr:uncharacterized protein MBM_08546 [Drepanopeziza brunnea f. sp. 'multigermtubi' MB_m1]EKD13103.1 hypothetical protein MBM_08546 [Drepanopeziza brunnea f. sp. 'multigermtubi' MB_m1]
MISINAIVAAAILAASVVTAAPAAELIAVAPADALAPRAERTIKLCVHRRWFSCVNDAPAPPNSCGQTPLLKPPSFFFSLQETQADQIQENMNYMSGGDMTDAVSSLDTRGFKCTFFVDAHCQTESGSFEFTGSLGNLKKHTGLEYYQDKISSYMCQ